MRQTAEVFKALGDPVRLRIVRLLLERELCVCELMQALEMPQYRVSRHLAVLRRAGLVQDRRRGPWVHYSLPPGHDGLRDSLLTGLRLALEAEPAVRQDLRRLRAGRPAVCVEGSSAR
jgi:ArsR family transcriptional regulator